MTRVVKLVCPQHPEVSLYEREVEGSLFDSPKVITDIDTGRQCPRCKKPYYEWECVPMEVT
jgi:hypothetical protein